MRDHAVSRNPQILTVEELFTDTYRVPLYQRAYAWTAAEIQTLLADVRDARLNTLMAESGRAPRDYYIGSLVVNAVRSDEQVVYEIVDGQQRLTTLFIILAVVPLIHSPEREREAIPVQGSVSFEGRDAAGEDLRRLAKDGADAIGRLETDGLSHAVELVEQAAQRGALPGSTGPDPVQGVAFSPADLSYLLKHVKILRTELPPETDLNHYFEVMNTRGEQLEKHEILKAQLISKLKNGDERRVFSQIWDACSVLDRHVQTQFSPSEEKLGGSPRSRVFGDDWNNFGPANWAQLFHALNDPPPPPTSGRDTGECGRQKSEHQDSGRLALSDVLHTVVRSGSEVETADSTDAESGSYGSITDFPNLLLHVLKIHRTETFTWGEATSNTNRVRLEDKYLLEEFARAMDHASSRGPHGALEDWVRQFAFRLLKTRYLMDAYVIRTVATTAGDDEENWVLHRAFKYQRDGTRRQLSASSTFAAEHDPRTEMQQGKQQLQRRLVMLQAMFQVSDTRRSSKYFLFQMLEWLHRQEPGSVDGAQFVEHLERMALSRLRSLQVTHVMDSGTHVPNFVFNVLDYELWRLSSIDASTVAEEVVGVEAAAELRDSASSFRFRYRTSVEHFYPVSPSVEHGHQPLVRHVRDRFGNLCIMSRSENSRRNNLMPIPKANEFRSTDQSLKFQLMAELAIRDKGWAESQIDEHGAAMRRVLARALTRAL